MPGSVWKTFFAFPFETGKLYRPFSCLTLALNWYVGKDNTIGYHIVNVTIHFFTAVFVYLVVRVLYKTPVLSRLKYSECEVYFCALLTSVLWVVNPLHTMAITYVVQRMASLAALFTVMAIFWYLKARLEPKDRIREVVYCCSCAFLALMSKENAVLLPLNLLLIDFIFFQKYDLDTFGKFSRVVLFVCSLAVVTSAVYFLVHSGILTNFFEPRGSRFFSGYQRALTESRILFMYLGLLLYPLPSRLSFNHDIVLSTSFFSPWTTFLSFVGIIALIYLSIRYVKKHPVISFAILFFFLNHAVESTVLNLELIFEHRNYLPSLFFFWPVSIGVKYLFDDTVVRNQVVRGVIFVLFSLILTSVGIGTYIRNMVYSSTMGLWLDTMEKAPLSARPLSNLGIEIGWGLKKSDENFGKALGLYMKALSNTRHSNSYKSSIMSNIGGLYYNYDMFDKALEYNLKSIEINPEFVDGYYNIARTYYKLGKFNESLEAIDHAITLNPLRSHFSNLKGLAFLWLNEPEKANFSFREALKKSSRKKDLTYHVGVSLLQLGQYKQAEWFLRIAQKSDADNIRISFSLLENSLRANDSVKIPLCLEYIFSHYSLKMIGSALQLFPREYSSAPVDVELIRPVIEKAGLDYVKKMQTTALLVN